MTSGNDLRDLIGSTAYDRSGDKIGKVEEIYLDEETGRHRVSKASDAKLTSTVTSRCVTSAQASRPAATAGTSRRRIARSSCMPRTLPPSGSSENTSQAGCANRGASARRKAPR